MQRETKGGGAGRCSSANYSCKYYANLSWHRNGEREFKCGDNAGKLNVHLGMGNGPVSSVGLFHLGKHRFLYPYQIIHASLVGTEKLILLIIDT